tara:strand:- start:338 stop:1099 length:762 start_codon:yes stop_codon:yes gene_type:complete
MKTDTIVKYLQPLQEKLINHDLYHNINSIDTLKIFMENHIFAVWDFMSLLKSLQIHLTCVQIPWKPVNNTDAARFINEIVLEEETDKINSEQTVSHFELYIDSMKEIGATTDQIYSFIDMIDERKNFEEAIFSSSIDQNIKSFLSFTFNIIESNEVHKIAAAFTFGRENVIPDMFIKIVKKISKENDLRSKKFIYYLERHIELDGNDHGPIALKMINNLCGEDISKWDDVINIAKKSMEMRIKLWNHINNQIK